MQKVKRSTSEFTLWSTGNREPQWVSEQESGMIQTRLRKSPTAWNTENEFRREDAHRRDDGVRVFQYIRRKTPTKT